MKTAPAHIIHQLNVHTTVSNLAAAKKLERNISTFVYTQVIPMLERLFDKQHFNECHYRFDNITIDVAVQEVADVEDAIRTALKNTLQQALQSADPVKLNQVDHDNISGDAKENRSVAGIADVQVIPQAASIIESFFFFLQHGRLPWWCVSMEQPFEEVTLADAISLQEASFSRRLLALMQSYPVAVTRLTLQFSDSLLVFFAGLLLPLSIFQAVTEGLATLSNEWDTINKNRSFQVYFWQLVFYKQTGLEALTGDAIGNTTANEEAQMKSRIQRMIAGFFQNRATDSLTTADSLGNNIATNQVDKTNNPVSADNLTTSDRRMGKTVLHLDDEKNILLPTPGVFAKKTAPSSSQHGLVVANAGLVLLHSFLPSFLRTTGLLAEKDFKDDVARHTAVHLLHYLATGRQAAHEYEMVFEKYMIRIPPDEPLHRFIELTAEMKAEASELLEAVIGHWAKLGKTSPLALQETFLQRQGKLITKEGRHQLIMEQDTTDILLNYLPWSIAMIKLPWLPSILYVEWDNR